MNNKILLLISAIIAGLIIWVGITFYEAYQPKPLQVQGEIDAQTYNISSKVAGRISQIAVKKGDTVKVGDFIFSISSDEVQAKLKQAKASKNAASAVREKADTGARVEEIKATLDQYKKAEAAQNLMETTYKRIKTLYDEGVLSEQNHDEAYTKLQASQYTTSAAKQLYIMAKEGARSEDKKAALAKEEVYVGKIDEVQAYIKELNLYSFHNGEVTSVLIYEGELAPTGFPVVTLCDMSDSWARFTVREDLLPMFKKGNKFDVTLPGLGDKTYQFEVTFISVMGSFATWKAPQAGQGFDMKSFEVHMKPINPIEDLRVGMSVLLSL
jgi:HlyD family secretion protein